MKYRFVVEKSEDANNEDVGNFGRSMLRIAHQEVFSADIDADEMVELMQVLWHLANKRTK